MRKEPSPCIYCEKKGCGAYHDICPDYQKWSSDTIDVEQPLYRDYVAPTTWNNRKRKKNK